MPDDAGRIAALDRAMKGCGLESAGGGLGSAGDSRRSAHGNPIFLVFSRLVSFHFYTLYYFCEFLIFSEIVRLLSL